MNTKRQNLLYLTAVEDAFNKAVIRSQVFRLLLQFKGENIRVFYVGLVPFRFYFQLKDPIRTFLAYRRGRRELRKFYSAENISLRFIPFFFPFRRISFYMKAFYLFVFLIQALPLVLATVLLNHIRLIQSRSYPASLVSYLCSRLLPLQYIFEARGFYPDEGVVYGVYKRGSADYCRWKRLEKKIADRAFRVIVESETFQSYIRHFSPQASVTVIPCYVDEAVFRFDAGERKTLRDRFRLDEKFVVTYCGTIGGWHDPAVQAGYFMLIRERVPEAHLLILTFSQYHDMIRRVLKENSVPENAYTLLSPAHQMIPQYLLMGDAGLLIIEDLPTARKAVSVKFGEYLACGLPVLCTPFVEGAARLIRKYDCGIILDKTDPRSFEGLDDLIRRYESIQQNGFQLVRRVLSIRVNGEKFLQIYREGRAAGGKL